MKSDENKFKFQKAIGLVLLIPSSVVLLFGLIGGIFSTDGLNIILGTLLISGTPLIFGAILYFNAKKKLLFNESIKYEKTVLNAATKNSGILNIALLSQETSLSLNESKKILDEFTIKGYCTVEVNDNGVVEYYFTSMLKE